MTTTPRPNRPLGGSLLAGLAIAATLSLAACSTSNAASGSSGAASSSASAAPKALKIGFSPFTLQVPALKGLSDGLTAAGKASGDTVVSADPKGDPSTQLQQLQQWVQLKQVDAIWVIPAAAKTVAPVLQQAQQKGIVVIASGKPSDYGMSAGAPGITFTEVDNTAYGTKIGELTAQCITQKPGAPVRWSTCRAPPVAEARGDQRQRSRPRWPRTRRSRRSSTSRPPRTGWAPSRRSPVPCRPPRARTPSSARTTSRPSAGSPPSSRRARTPRADLRRRRRRQRRGQGGGVKSGKVFADVAFDFQKDLGQNLQELHSLAANPKAAGKQLVTPIQVITQDS